MNEDDPRDTHEALSPREHEEVCATFFKIAEKEVLPRAHNAIATLMFQKRLGQRVLGKLLSDLWINHTAERAYDDR